MYPESAINIKKRNKDEDEEEKQKELKGYAFKKKRIMKSVKKKTPHQFCIIMFICLFMSKFTKYLHFLLGNSKR